jgi:ubiquinone/menaquinone biosynthesis C-methylase UbiE
VREKVVRLILWLNRVFRRPRVEGRESPEAYSDWEYRWGRSLVEDYLEPAGDLRGKRVLDIGCGLGGKTVAYGEGGAAETIGVDISEENVRASGRFALSSPRSFRWGFFVGDAARLPAADASFDTVIANDAMEHFGNPDGALAEIARVTRPGGAIWIFFTPHYSPLGSHLYDYVYTPWCHLLFRRRDLEAAIREVLVERLEGWSCMEVDSKVGSIMKSYDTDLNHMSIRRFRGIVARTPGLAVTQEKLKPAKFSFLGFLTRVPGVRELFTGTVVCRLARRG